jgi:XapX domain-containing protein
MPPADRAAGGKSQEEEDVMKVYLLSLGAGILVGVIYGLLDVRSPAPPLVALVGLLGILAGEQIVPVARQYVSDQALAAAWRQAKGASHVFGMLPGRNSGGETSTVNSTEKTS